MWPNSHIVLLLLLSNVAPPVESTTDESDVIIMEEKEKISPEASLEGLEPSIVEWSAKNNAAGPPPVTASTGFGQNQAVSQGDFLHRREMENDPMWTPLGDDIEGNIAGMDLGKSVSMSKNGQFLAVGAPSPSRRGLVRVLAWDGSKWSQVGNDIRGKATGDQFGACVSLSRNGLRLLVGAPGTGDASGHASVYERQAGSSNWVKLGDDIYGSDEYDLLGRSVSISDDGELIAIASPQYRTIGVSGRVQIFKWERSWKKIGTIDGNHQWKMFGSGLSMAGNGNRIAVGAESGSAHVFEYKGGSSWEEIVQFPSGTRYETFGWAVAMSQMGDRIAVQATGGEDQSNEECFTGPSGVHYSCQYAATDTYVRVFEQLGEEGSVWEQMGEDINRKATYSSGGALSLSDDGHRVAFGTPWIYPTGYAYVAEWSGSSWEQLGEKLDNDVTGDTFRGTQRYHVSMSGDGERLAIGAPNYGDSGLTRVFEMSKPDDKPVDPDPEGNFPPGFNQVTCAYHKCLRDLRKTTIGVPPVSLDDDKLDGIVLYSLSNATRAQLQVYREGHVRSSLYSLRDAMKWIERVSALGLQATNKKAVRLSKRIGTVGTSCATAFVEDFLRALHGQDAIDQETIDFVEKKLRKARRKAGEEKWKKSVANSRAAAVRLLAVLEEENIPLCGM